MRLCLKTPVAVDTDFGELSRVEVGRYEAVELP